MVDFSEEAGKLEQEAKDKGWDKKAEEDVKKRFGKDNNQQQAQQGTQQGNQ